MSLLPSRSIHLARQSAKCRRVALKALFSNPQPLSIRALHHGVPRLFPRSEPKNEHVKPKTQGELSLLEKLDMRNYETSIVPLTLDIPDRSFGPLPPIHRRPDGTWGYEDGSVQTKSISIHAMNIGGRISQYLHPSANGMTTDPLLLDAFGAWDISELSEEELTLYQQVQEDYARELTWNEEQESFDEKPVSFDNIPAYSQATSAAPNDDALDKIHRELDDMISSLSHLLKLDSEDRKALESKDSANPEEFDRLFQAHQRQTRVPEHSTQARPLDTPRVLEAVEPAEEPQAAPSSTYRVDHDRIEYTPHNQPSSPSPDTFDMDTSNYTRGEEMQKTLSELKATIGDHSQSSEAPSSLSEEEGVFAKLPENIPGIDVVLLGQMDAMVSDGLLIAYVGPTEDETKPVWTRMVDPLLVDTFGVWDEKELTEQQQTAYQALWNDPNARRMTRVEKNPETGEFVRCGHVTYADSAAQTPESPPKPEDKLEPKPSGPAGLGEIYDKLKNTFKKSSS